MNFGAVTVARKQAWRIAEQLEEPARQRVCRHLEVEIDDATARRLAVGFQPTVRRRDRAAAVEHRTADVRIAKIGLTTGAGRALGRVIEDDDP